MEVIGKFDRAKRFADKIESLQQKIRIHYQAAWTYLNWYDDYFSFYEEFKIFKSLVAKEPNLKNIELYHNLYNLLKSISSMESTADYVEFDFYTDEADFIDLLQQCSINPNKPSSALLSKFYLSIISIFNNIADTTHVSQELIKLKTYFKESINHLDIPFEQLKDFIDIFSELLPDDNGFDDLIDTIAELEATRVSETVLRKSIFE